MIWHLIKGVAPDDPSAPQLLGEDNFDPAVAATLLTGTPVALLDAFEPVFVEFSGQTPRRWSYAVCPIGFLASTAGWLVTHRGTPFDVRFGSRYDGLPPTPREKLVAAVTEFKRTDQLPADVATLMRGWLANRALTVSDEISSEIANRVLDVHRAFIPQDSVSQAPVEEAGRASRPGPIDTGPERARFELFDLRWVLDSHESRCRRQLPTRRAAVATFDAAAGRSPNAVEKVEHAYKDALNQCSAGRAALQDALGWLAAEQSAELLRIQAETGSRAEGLQRLVGALSVFFLGPTLVASLYGAQDSWFDDHAELRTASMFVLMGLLALCGAGALEISRSSSERRRNVPWEERQARAPNEPRPWTLRWIGWLMGWCVGEFVAGWRGALEDPREKDEKARNERRDTGPPDREAMGDSRGT